MRKIDKMINCEICGDRVKVTQNRFTCSTRCSSTRARLQTNFIQSKIYFNWNEYLDYKLGGV